MSDEAPQLDQPERIPASLHPEKAAWPSTSKTAHGPPADETKLVRFEFPRDATPGEMLDALKEMRRKARGEETGQPQLAARDVRVYRRDRNQDRVRRRSVTSTAGKFLQPN